MNSEQSAAPSETGLYSIQSIWSYSERNLRESDELFTSTLLSCMLGDMRFSKFSAECSHKV